jgi:hypothetical protein
MANVPFDEWAVLYRKMYGTNKNMSFRQREHNIAEARTRRTDSGQIQKLMQHCIFNEETYDD